MITQEHADRIKSLELKTTADGSLTLFVPGLQEHYHSVHGALQESEHVFIKAGLNAAREQFAPPINILEIGFGTGLNAVLTLAEARKTNLALAYDTVEAFPLPWQLLEQVQANYPAELQPIFGVVHNCAWNQPLPVYSGICFRKWQGRLQELELMPQHYQVVYFDAFAPEKQPELWNEDIFRKIRAAMQPKGALVTYCAKGSVKRAMRAAGFEVEALPGPPGKREMTRAICP